MVVIILWVGQNVFVFSEWVRPMMNSYPGKKKTNAKVRPSYTQLVGRFDLCVRLLYRVGVYDAIMGHTYICCSISFLRQPRQQLEPLLSFWPSIREG